MNVSRVRPRGIYVRTWTHPSQHPSSQGSWLEKLADILYSAQDKNLKPYGLRAAVYDKISDMIGGINVDDAGQKRFEAELNKLYGGIMTQFRREFHDLLDETDIRFFSCVVARFEASIILRIFNLPSKSAVYMKKNRLKEKIRKSKAPDKDKFLLFWKMHSTAITIIQWKLTNKWSPDLFDGFDAVAGEVDAEALELGGVVVLVLEDEV